MSNTTYCGKHFRKMQCAEVVNRIRPTRARSSAEPDRSNREVLKAMPKKGMDFESVRAIAAELPDVKDASGPRGLAFKVQGKLLACTAIHSSAEANSLAVCIDPQLRAELLASEPEVYYLKPHYESYPMVLVRLEQVRRAALRKLLGTALVFVTSQPPARSRAAKPKAGRRRAVRPGK